MDWKNLDNSKKYFIVLGIPCLIFVFLVMISAYVLFLSFYLTAFGVLLFGLMNKKNFYNKLTKVSVLMVIMFFINFWNVTHLPSQIVRHFPGGRQQLLNPNHEGVLELRDNFYDWHLDTYGIDFDEISEEHISDLEIKVKRVDYFIRTEIMEYTSDTEAPYYAFDHVASLDEIFASDTDGDGLLQDDCDGISVLTASLLLNMGYNAYVAECLSHWNTIIFPKGADPRTLEGFEQGIHLYNSWGRPSYYIFNQEEVLIPPGRPLIGSLTELFFEPSTFEEDYVSFFEGAYFEAPLLLLLIILYLLLFLASFLIYHIVRIGMPGNRSIAKDKIKYFISKKIIKSSLYISLISVFSAFVIYWLAFTGMGFLGTLILCLTLIIAMRLAEFGIKSTNDR